MKGKNMATRIELPKTLVLAAFTQRKQSLDRSIKAATNPLIHQALQDELNQVVAAMASMAEIK
jgi:hypothetical protein